MNIRQHLILATSALALSAAAADIQVNRYSFQTLFPQPQQSDLLSAVIETRFPRSVATIGDAINYMLARSGYRLIHTDTAIDAMALELPAVHRSIGPLPVRTAIGIVAGPDWRLLEDSETRTIWFERIAAGGAGPLPANPPPFQSAAAANDSDWLLDPSSTLSANLASWAAQAGWRLQWDAQHDYEIEFPVTYTGSFRHAVEAALEHYRTAPVPLTGRFYNQNTVLLITPASSTR